MESGEDSVLGQMTLTIEGDVIQSSGSLENNEKVSGVINQALKLIQVYQPSCENQESNAETGTEAIAEDDNRSKSDYKSELSYKKVSFVYSDRAYVLMRSGNKIHMVHRRISEAPHIGHLMTHAED